jgi:hypothetical protein
LENNDPVIIDDRLSVILFLHGIDISQAGIGHGKIRIDLDGLIQQGNPLVIVQRTAFRGNRVRRLGV